MSKLILRENGYYYTKSGYRTPITKSHVERANARANSPESDGINPLWFTHTLVGIAALACRAIDDLHDRKYCSERNTAAYDNSPYTTAA